MSSTWSIWVSTDKNAGNLYKAVHGKSNTSIIAGNISVELKSRLRSINKLINFKLVMRRLQQFYPSCLPVPTNFSSFDHSFTQEVTKNWFIPKSDLVRKS